MFQSTKLSVKTPDQENYILHDINASFVPRKLNAIVGPSGCGKTTLIQSLLKLIEAEGKVYYNASSVESPEQLSGHVGIVPQFSVAHSQLTISECLSFASQLNTLAPTKKEEKIQALLDQVGLFAHRSKLVQSLSGGQLRRLGLALELINNPDCLICDEVTSGLDPLSEDQIISLLKKLSDQNHKTFLCIIHNLAKLSDFDHITVLYEGYLIFQGDFATLLRWFNLSDPQKLYHCLSQKKPTLWANAWSQHSAMEAVPSTVKDDTPANKPKPSPSFFKQLTVLLHRRFKLLLRDTGYLWLLLALTFGFPTIVVIFALKGLPQIQTLSIERNGSFVEEMQNNLRYQIEATEIATQVTGIVMFQVILLTLMGANNGAREIAEERKIFEKERLNGLRSSAYGLSKLIFVGTIALFQGIWMTLFVKTVCQFPGSFLLQGIGLSLCCVSMSWICLGLSASLPSPEKASLLSIYLVGFQLPLSGIVLSLPDSLVWTLRPFINAYWSWAGYFLTMKEYKLYDAYRMNDQSWFPNVSTSLLVLIIQALLGAVLVFWGCKKGPRY